MSAQPTGGAPTGGALELLGAPPLCEVSAALAWPGRPGHALLGDNEVQGGLFAAEVVDGRLEVTGELEMPAKRRPRDIEALAALPDGDVLVVGSHSRNKDCEIKDNRRRMRVLSVTDDGRLDEVAYLDDHALWSVVDATGPGWVSRCVEQWFAPETSGAEAACRALLATDRPCTGPDLEGAVLLGDAVWFGLRSPLSSAGHALVLRAPAAALTGDEPRLQFDAVVELDLGGRGVRELALEPDGERLWVIGGPPSDSAAAHALFHVKPSALASDVGVVSATWTAELPTSSEALVFGAPGQVHVLIDGDEGDGDGACEVPSRQVRIELPE